LGRVAAYGWALGARYRVEQVFGSVEGVYGSYVGCRRWCYARVLGVGDVGVVELGAVVACGG